MEIEENNEFTDIRKNILRALGPTKEMVTSAKNRIEAITTRKKSIKTDNKNSPAKAPQAGSTMTASVPVLNIPSSEMPPFDRINWNRLHAEQGCFMKMAMTPLVLVGCGPAFECLKPAYTKFALDFNAEVLQTGLQKRVQSPLNQTQIEGLKAAIQSSFLDKLPADLQSMIAIGPCLPTACQAVTIAEKLSPLLECIMWGGSAGYEVTNMDRSYLGSVRMAFAGDRMVAAANLITVLKFLNNLRDGNTGSAGAITKHVKEAKDWLRNLTLDTLSFSLYSLLCRSMRKNMQVQSFLTE